MPALSGHLPSMRMMYCAGPGNILIEGDYAQQELRVMFAVGHDEVLGANLASGDVYTMDAKMAFDLPPTMVRCECKEECLTPDQHVKKTARQACKVTHLTGQYGGGLNRVFEAYLEEDRTIKRAFVKKVFDQMWNPKRGIYKGTCAYWEREHQLVMGRHPIYSETRILGRRLYYPRPPERSRLVNWPIQATAADMTALAEDAIDQELKARHITWCFQIMNQHDAILMECRDEPGSIKECIAIMRRGMEQEFEIEGKRWRFPVDFQTGYIWGEMKKYKEKK